MKRWLILGVVVASIGMIGAGVGFKRDPFGTLASAIVGSSGSSSPGVTVTYPDYDDEPGVADGAGADPAPHPGSQVAKVRFGRARAEVNTYGLNTLAEIVSYNNNATGVFENGNMFSSGLTFEYSFEGAAGARSGAPWHEFYWQYSPATYWVTFGAGSAATSTLSDQYTFTGGENCRAVATGSSFNGGSVRFNCLDGDGPEVADAVTGCTGTCTGGTPTAVVSAVSRDRDWRPFFYELFTGLNRVSWRQVRGVDGGYPSDPWIYWLHANNGTNRLYLGRGGETDTRPYATVNIPTGNHYTSDSHVGDLFRGGDIGIDGSDDGGADGYFLFTTQTMSAADDPYAYGIHPTTTVCFEHTGTFAAGTDDRFMPIAAYQNVKVVAFGCGNNTSDAAATVTDGTFTLEDGSGNVITLSGTLTCAPKDSAMAWVTVNPQTDGDARLTSGERLRFDTVTVPNPDTDDLTFCIAYQYSRQ